jgi:hypothetical protein
MPTGAEPSPHLLSGRLRVAVVAAALAAGMLLGGCSDSHATPSTKGTVGSSRTQATTSAAPSPLPTVEAPPAAPRPVRGTVGQQAFARHVMALWAYALRTNDAEPLATLAGGNKSCGGCAALIRQLGMRRSQGWTVDLAGVRVRKTRIARQGDVQVLRASVDIPQSDSYNTDGTFRNTSPAHPAATFEVRMRFTDRRYRLVSFTVS